MATATTPEHVETQARAEPVAANPSRERVQKISLDAKIERVATDLRTEIKDVHAKIDKLSAETNDRFDRLNTKIDKLSADSNDKFDRLNEKITQILINQSRGQ